MARVYVSCSDDDVDLSMRIRDWLRFQDYEPVVLDDHTINKHEGWTGWQRSLAQTLEFCDVVILVLTPEWTSSKWCFSEFTKAYSMGKTILAIIEKPLREAFSEPGIPVFDLTRGRDGALARLASVLRDTLPQAGDVFDFDPKRKIYPGLKFFEEADHAIFFSRDDDVRRIVDRLNTRRRQGGSRLIALLGASGTGISSLMRAGVIPRLGRDSQNWIILPVMRPLFKPVEEFSKSIAHIFGKPERWQEWHALFMGHDFKGVAFEVAEQLRERFNHTSAHILIAIDQAEELFSISDPYEAGRFLDILGAVFDDDMPYTGIAALRPDFLSNFQTADQLSHVIEEISPRLMPLSGLRDIITGPGRIANIKIQDALVEAVIHDAAQEGALPLVEYTLNYLYELSAPNYYLTLENYNEIGAEFAGNTPLGNIIAKTCETLLDANHLTAQELSAARDFLSKALIWRDADNRIVARPFPLNELDARTRTLAKRFLNRGLLSKREISDVMCVEYTHLAIVRHWPRLEQWLDVSEPYYENIPPHTPDYDGSLAQVLHEGDILDLTLEGEMTQTATSAKTKKSSSTTQASVSAQQDEEARLAVPPHVYSSSDAAYDLDKKDYVNSKSENALVRGKDSAENSDAGIDTKILENFRSKRYQDEEAELGYKELRKKRSVISQAIWFCIVVGIGIFIGINWPIFKKMASDPQSIASWWQQLTGQKVKVSENLPNTRNTNIDKTSENKTLAEEVPKPKPIEVANSKKDDPALLQKTSLAALMEKSENQIPAGKPLLSMLLAFEALGHEEAQQKEKEKSVTVLAKSLAMLQNAMIFEGHQGEIEDIAFSKNGLYIATASLDNTVRVWDLTTKKVLNIFSDHKDAVKAILFNQDSKFLVTASMDKTAKIWDLKNGVLQITFKGHTDGVTCVTMNEQGNLIATGSKDMTARVWSPVDGKEEYVLKGHTGPITSVHFSSNGKWLATSSEDKTIRIWDAKNGTPILVLEGHTSPVRSVFFSQDSTFLISASDDQTVRTWQADTGKETFVFKEHTDGVTYASLAFEGNYVVSTARDGKALLWDRVGGKVHSDLKNIPGGVKKAVFSRDGHWMAVAAYGKAIHVLPTKMYSSRLMFDQHTDSVFSAEFSKDGEYVVTASRDNTARVWKTASGEQTAILSGHTDQVHYALFSPDRSLIATASRDKTVHLWKADTGEEIRVLSGHEGDVNRLSFSPDGKFLLSCSDDKTIRIWDVKTGQQVKVLKDHTDKIWSAVYSIDGTRIISASQDKTVRIWDVSTGKTLHVLNSHKAPVLGVTVSPDGKTVASASADRSVRFWDIESGKIQPQILMHPDTVLSVSFGGNGQMVITAGSDKTARIWNIQSDEPLYVLKGHEGQIFSSVLDKTGNWALTTSSDGVRLWRLFSNPEELSFYAKSLLPRCLAAHERLELGLGSQSPSWCKEIDEARLLQSQ